MPKHSKGNGNKSRKKARIDLSSEQMVVDANTSPVEFYKNKLLQYLLDVLTVLMDENENKKIQSLKDQIELCETLNGLYTRIAIILHTAALPEVLIKEFDNFINHSKFKGELRKSLGKRDSFKNNADAAIFETRLAELILKEGSRTQLQHINQMIIDYCILHKSRLEKDKSETLKSQLIRYHICTEDDFYENTPSQNLSFIFSLLGPKKQTKSAVEIFISLLSRDLSDERNITELITLHLIFFNYNHIYDPAVSPEGVIDPQISEKRTSIHQSIRKKGKDGLFDPAVRGRVEKYAKHPTREFGITDKAALPLSLQSWHRYEFTPFKYRSDADLSSPLVQMFKKYDVPFIAGPSGTLADCFEGCVMLGIPFNQIEQYIILLSAAEVALGCHSFFEVLLPAQQYYGNDNLSLLYKILVNRDKYKHILNSTDGLPAQVFERLMNQYPEFLDPNSRIVKSAHAFSLMNEEHIEQSVVWIQRQFRANSSYRLLKGGTVWKRSGLMQGDSNSIAQFQSISTANIRRLTRDLGQLAPEELLFVQAFVEAPSQITHYTNSDAEILRSGVIYSYVNLDRLKGDSFVSSHSELGDISQLGNHNNVFFRYELIHDRSKRSRFGETQFIFDANSTSLYLSGWVSVHDMLQTSIKPILYKGKVIRTSQYDCYSEVLKMRYSNTNIQSSLPTKDQVFYGADIKCGLALMIVRELRMIGGDYYADKIADISLQGMNTLLSELFRVEAKIPGAVYLTNVSFEYFAPHQMKSAILANNIEMIACLLNAGMDINAELEPGVTPLDYAAKQSNDRCFDALRYLFDQDESSSGDNDLLLIMIQSGSIRSIFLAIKEFHVFDLFSDERFKIFTEMLKCQYAGVIDISKENLSEIEKEFCKFIDDLIDVKHKVYYLDKLFNESSFLSTIFEHKPQCRSTVFANTALTAKERIHQKYKIMIGYDRQKSTQESETDYLLRHVS